jgi:hypothetical protein
VRPQKVESEMAEEKKSEKTGQKEVFCHLAEYTNGRNWPDPEQVDLHSCALVSVQYNRLAKKGLYWVVVKIFLKRIHEFFTIFKNFSRICGFRSFESFD